MGIIGDLFIRALYLSRKFKNVKLNKAGNNIQLETFDGMRIQLAKITAWEIGEENVNQE